MKRIVLTDPSKYLPDVQNDDEDSSTDEGLHHWKIPSMRTFSQEDSLQDQIIHTMKRSSHVLKAEQQHDNNENQMMKFVKEWNLPEVRGGGGGGGSVVEGGVHHLQPNNPAVAAAHNAASILHILNRVNIEVNTMDPLQFGFNMSYPPSPEKEEEHIIETPPYRRRTKPSQSNPPNHHHHPQHQQPNPPLHPHHHPNHLAFSGTAATSHSLPLNHNPNNISNNPKNHSSHFHNSPQNTSPNHSNNNHHNAYHHNPSPPQGIYKNFKLTAEGFTEKVSQSQPNEKHFKLTNGQMREKK